MFDGESESGCPGLKKCVLDVDKLAPLVGDGIDTDVDLPMIDPCVSSRFRARSVLLPVCPTLPPLAARGCLLEGGPGLSGPEGLSVPWL